MPVMEKMLDGTSDNAEAAGIEIEPVQRHYLKSPPEASPTSKKAVKV